MAQAVTSHSMLLWLPVSSIASPIPPSGPAVTSITFDWPFHDVTPVSSLAYLLAQQVSSVVFDCK